MARTTSTSTPHGWASSYTPSGRTGSPPWRRSPSASSSPRSSSHQHLSNNIYDIIDQTISVHGYERTKASIKQADYYIHPEIETVSFTDYQFNTIQYLFNRGEEAVLANWDIFVELNKIKT